MSGIYIASLLTTALVLAIYGGIVMRLKSPTDGRWLLLAFLIALPLQPLAFYLVRVPLNSWLVGKLGEGNSLYQFLTTFYAPLTEEPAKLIPLLIPAICRDIRKENLARYAMAIGLAFGIGEIWFIAERLAQNPSFAGLPFYQFGGFAGERFIVCLIHGAFVSVSLLWLRRGLLVGLLLAMALHYFGNFPIFLLNKNAFGWGQTAWQIIVMLWLQLYFIGGIVLLARLAYGKMAVGRFIFGKARCPECSVVYDRPFFGFNLGPRRYERCTNCRHWHMINFRTDVPDEDAPPPAPATGTNDFTKHDSLG